MFKKRVTYQRRRGHVVLGLWSSSYRQMPRLLEAPESISERFFNSCKERIGIACQVACFTGGLYSRQGDDMKIIGIRGSPRKGNSKWMLDRVLLKAVSNWAEVETLLLREMDLHMCRGCLAGPVTRPGALRDSAAGGDDVGNISEGDQHHQAYQEHKADGMYQSFGPGGYAASASDHLK